MITELTEKRLQNKRFKTTEESILLSCCNLKDSLSIVRLIRTARISRSTFYRHHQNLAHITSDYESYIYHKTEVSLTRLLKIKHLHLSTLYERLLNIISTNVNIFSFLLEFGNPDFLNRLILILEPKIFSITKLNDEEALNIYVGEVASLIKSWRATGFDRTSIPALTAKIMYLTDTASARLRPLTYIGRQDNQNQSQNNHSASS